MKTRTLEEMQNRPTAYEVAIDGVPVAFTVRKTKAALLAIAREHGDAILAKPGAAEAVATYSKARGWEFGPVRVDFTGRTERDVCIEQMKG